MAVAVDFACAALPLIVAAKRMAFAGPPVKPPVAVAVAFAVPPSIAVEVALRCACYTALDSRVAAGRLSNCRSSIGCASVCGGRASGGQKREDRPRRSPWQSRSLYRYWKLSRQPLRLRYLLVANNGIPANCIGSEIIG